MILPPWDLVLRSCRGARQVVLAAPYMKTGALTRVLGEVNSRASITCVTRWTPQDIASGVSDIACRPFVLERGGSFRLHARLHAKYYRFDDYVLVGSSNVTAAGLGYSGVGNLEILCAAQENFDSRAFEDQLLHESRAVTDAEFLLWQRLSTIAPRATWGVDPIGTNADGWKPQTRAPEHLWMAYTGQDLRIASRDERRLAKSDLEAIAVPAGLPKEDFDIWVGSRLLASPFGQSVMRLHHKVDRIAWAELAAEWGISESDAARSMETVIGWLAHFWQS